MNYSVLPYDLLDIEKVDVNLDYVKLTMYCEIVGDDIDPDGPPTFQMVIKRQDGELHFSTEDDDFSSNEKGLYEKCIKEFLNEMIDKIKLPPTKELVGLDVFDINPQ